MLISCDGVGAAVVPAAAATGAAAAGADASGIAPGTLASAAGLAALDALATVAVGGGGA